GSQSPSESEERMSPKPMVGRRPAMIENEAKIRKVGSWKGRKYLPNDDVNNDTPSPIGNMRTSFSESGNEKQDVDGRSTKDDKKTGEAQAANELNPEPRGQ
ncbi:14541_t:CDS:1, partial [Acaulospora morrowiae]